MSSSNEFDTVIVTKSKLLRRPDGRAAILLTGHRRPNEDYSVAFEVTLETIPILREELAKAEAFLKTSTGTA